MIINDRHIESLWLESHIHSEVRLSIITDRWNLIEIDWEDKIKTTLIFSDWKPSKIYSLYIEWIMENILNNK